jgi:hypothetical protein
MFRPTNGQLSLPKKLLVLAVVVFSAILLAQHNPLSPTLFQQRQLSGQLLTWNASQRSGLIEVNGHPIPLQASNQVIEQPGPGCSVRAYGTYQDSAAYQRRLFVAETLIIDTCPAQLSLKGLWMARHR